MIVSYTIRLLCLTLISIGLLQILLELLLWGFSGICLRFVDTISARQRERLLFLVQVVPLVGALFLAACLWIPHYARGEGDTGPERIGLCSLALVAGAALWFGMALLRGLRLAFATARFARACRSVGHAVDCRRINTPILCLPNVGCNIALVGLFKPIICIPQSQADGISLSPQALEIVLDHEQSHAAQQDNWKLFFLSAIPRLHLRLSGGASWMEFWRSAAEWAADDDAVRGDGARACLLAETLVAGSRQFAPRNQHIVATMLVSGFSAGDDRVSCRTDLESRIDRLLFRRPIQPAKCGSLLLFAIAALGFGTGMISMAPDFHKLSEYLLHLG
jgi:hypothetical protein